MLGVGGAVAAVARLAAPVAEAIAETLVREGHGIEGLGAVNGEGGEGLAGAGLGGVAGLLDDGAQAGAEVGGRGAVMLVARAPCLPRHAAPMIVSSASNSRLQWRHRSLTRAGSSRFSNSLPCLVLL